MAKQSNLREKFDNLAAAEALEGAGPKGLDESLARLSVVKPDSRLLLAQLSGLSLHTPKAAR